MSIALLPPFDAPHAASQADLIFNEPTVGNTALFTQEHQEYRRQPEYRRISPQEAQSYLR
jgi:hypothetical protein